jgi:1-acyl-sn-glycerol-3-phosphate acyltransferase
MLEVWCRVFWRMEVQGRDRLPATGAFVVSPVHRSYIDFAVIGAAIPRVMRFMGKDSVWKAAWAARILDHMGAFPVNRERVDRSALRNCEEALALGDPVVMFPEGRRKEGPVVEDLQEGPAWVACRHRVPIVPVGIGNSDRAMPIGAKLLRPVKLTVIIGEPIYPDVPLTGRVPRGAVAAVTEQLRDEVQRCYDRSKG